MSVAHSLWCIQVYGDDRVPMKTVLSELVQPVIAGKVDMAMVEYSDKVCVCVCPPNGVCSVCFDGSFKEEKQ